MREADFLLELSRLLNSEVMGLNQAQKMGLIRTLFDEAQNTGGKNLPVCQIVPFVTGRRPIDEVTSPGLGSSDNTSMILEKPEEGENKTYILYYLKGLEYYSLEELDSFALDISLSFAGTDGSQQTLPVEGWNKRPLEPMVFEKDCAGNLELRTVSIRETINRNLVLILFPERDFLPGKAWSWESLDPLIRQSATDFQDPFTFGQLHSQLLHLSIRLTRRGVPVSTSVCLLDICDTRRYGFLYQRVVEGVIKPDTAKQGQAKGIARLDFAYHPWFPVLHIGSDKAALYTDVLVEDIVHKKRHLTDPRWLMRVGLYLEFLTCIGIFEAVKGDMGDLLTPAEREAYEHHLVFKEIRKRLNPEGWRKVWELHEIAFPRFGVPQTGQVSALNLLQKKKATLAFLKVHHDDLKHAIELAGPNKYNSQETWHRVFRDAERAVLRKTAAAFPELAYLDINLKNFILWHQKGKFDISGMKWLPKQFTTIFGDQDGLFASACHQYQESMNDVAEWAKYRGLMDYTGKECVPEQVSLLLAYMENDEPQIERLQYRDGYNGSLETLAKLSGGYKSPTDQVYKLMSEIAIFSILSVEERKKLAEAAREIRLGPMERIIVEGREGTSLFLVGEGKLEVLVRQLDGVDKLVDVRREGDLFGEISLLTGAPRTATVRAADSAVVYEIGKDLYEPIIKARPKIVNELAIIMEARLRNIRQHREAYNTEKEVATLTRRIRHFFFLE